MKKLLLRNRFRVALAAAGFLLAAGAQAANVNVSQVLTGTNNWYRTNIYTLNGAAFVMSNAVLNIEAGTVIKGHNVGSQGTNVAALYVTVGGKIFAEGTPHHPIIFTADVDDTTLPDDMALWGSSARGLWGGVVIFGQSVINSAVLVAGDAANPRYEVYEGLEDITVGGQQVFRFGGTDDNDNSGVLRYVSIRHGGAVLAPNKEINGLSLGAVGRGTTIEYVESYCAADDGFEFFGGTVNTKYLVSSFNDDDSFDTDMGYRGTNQFWFAIQAPDKRNYGMELNGQLNEVTSSANPANPRTPMGTFKVYNMTLIGSGAGNTLNTGGNDYGMALRPYASPTIENAIFTDFNGPTAILLDTAGGLPATNCWTEGYATLKNNLWWNFSNVAASTNNTAVGLGGGTLATNWFTTESLTNQISDPMLTSISRTNVGALLDPRPNSGSPAYSDAATVPNDSFLTQVNYRGAFGSNDLWIANWTALSEYGILQPASIQTNMVAQILTGTNNWYRTNIYTLNGAAFVMSNAVLNIEAGTVIKGHNLGGQGTNVAALYVTVGGKINAIGTPQNPIIFTADVDDTTLPDDMALWGSSARGLWGGLVIFGQSVINSAVLVAGDAANPRYEVYEGLEDITVGGQQVFRFGGTDYNDNSGVLRYVSIRHGGAVLAPNKEINGLSLGAVGRGTTIEYVESYCAADDGFEFFGGTVNTKYLVSSFNDDDSFDTDMGYSGTNQFWFAIQAPDKRNYGMELNGQLNEVISSANPSTPRTPMGTFKVYNMTVIGSGAGNTLNSGGNDYGMALRPYASPTIENAIFTDFNGSTGIFLDTVGGLPATNCWTEGYATLKNNLWWNFSNVAASTNNTAAGLGGGTLATNWFTTESLTNQISDPMLTSISRTNVGAFLDPRPKSGSPANSDYAAAPSGLTATSYRGAFAPGRGNWAADWTALSEYGVMGGAGASNPSLRTSIAAVVPSPTAPILSIIPNGGNAEISFATQAGYTYQLQSTAPITGTWTNVGSAILGTGAAVTNAAAISGDEQYFRVLAQ